MEDNTMKNMKKLIAFALAVLMLLSLAACAQKSADNGVKTYKIGICNYVDDASLNQIVENIQNRLTAIGAERMDF